MIGTGIQIFIIDNLKVSLESTHDFVNNILALLPGSYLEQKSIFNTEILVGINYKPVDFLEAGLLFSKYLEYKNPFFAQYEKELENTPYGINFGGKYIYNKFEINFFYQISGLEFKTNGSPLTEYKKSQYLGIGFGFNL